MLIRTTLLAGLSTNGKIFEKFPVKKTLSILIFAITSWTNAAAQNIDSAAVETLMDQAWEEILSQDNAVPGAVITVVKDGDVLLSYPPRFTVGYARQSNGW